MKTLKICNPSSTTLLFFFCIRRYKNGPEMGNMGRNGLASSNLRQKLIFFCAQFQLGSVDCRMWFKKMHIGIKM